MIVAPKFIYSSSPDRGLDILLHLWSHIRKVFPEATLRIFYGFDNWQKNIDSGQISAESLRMYNDIKAHMDQPGVTYVGPVSQEQLAKEWQAADIWFYPTNFTETYCITALEAMMSDTIIVCTKLAGLIATVGDRGILIEGEGDQPARTAEYRERALAEVCAILRDNKRREAVLKKAKAWAKQQTWANRAKEWLNIFGISHQTPLTSYYEDVAKLKEIYDPAYYPSK